MKYIKSSCEILPPCGWWSRGYRTSPQTETPGCCCWSSWCRTCSLRATHRWLWTHAHMLSPPEEDEEEEGGMSLKRTCTQGKIFFNSELGRKMRFYSASAILGTGMMFCVFVCILTTMSLKLSVLGLLLSVLWISSLWRLIPLTFTSWTSLETHIQ